MSKLKELRESKKISRPELARLTNVNVRTLEGYEQGLKNIDGAKLDTLINISDALNCEVWDILESDELIEKLKRRYG